MDVNKIELNLIAQDADDIIQLIKKLPEYSDSGAICLGLPPYLAFFAEEANIYFQTPKGNTNNKYNKIQLFESCQEEITRLRVRVKLFDDTKGGLDRLINTLLLSSNKSIEWYLKKHKGIKKIFFRCLQPDLGIYYLNEHAICTTHIALLTIGLTYKHLQTIELSDFDNLGNFSHEFMKSIGSYIGSIANHLNDLGYFLPNSTGEQFVLPEFKISHNEYFGIDIYKHIDSAMDIKKEGLSAALIFLVSQINYVERVFSKLLPKSSIFLFRVRFLTAYHATKAINELNNLNGYSENKDFLCLIETIAMNEDSKKILGLRSVRNSFTHYGIRCKGIDLVSSRRPFEELIEFQSRCSLIDLANLASRQLLNISEAFKPFVSKNLFLRYKALLGDHT